MNPAPMPWILCGPGAPPEMTGDSAGSTATICTRISRTSGVHFYTANEAHGGASWDGIAELWVLEELVRTEMSLDVQGKVSDPAEMGPPHD